jgi:EAL and modified HD-GYP domain-containing signal transduction protein
VKVLYIARQPIFNKSMNVYGYELLFRADINKTAYTGVDPISPTATVFGGLFELGLNSLVGDKKAFVNFSYEFVMSDSIELIEPDKMVIEILEDTIPDNKLLSRIDYLRNKGYYVALDDYTLDKKTMNLRESVNMLKYDLRKTPIDDLLLEIKAALAENKILVAEKIENMEEFTKAKEMGFHLFQGYFFSKPNIVGGIKLKKTTNKIYQRLIDELKSEEPSFDKLSEIVAMDTNMAYRLLSVASRRKIEDKEIFSIKKALVKLGLKELERWVHVLMLQEISKNKPLELMRLSLVRSKFGEFIAANSRYSKRKHEITLMCLFSVIDAMIDEPMEKAIDEISLSQDVKNALINGEGELMNVGKIVLSYEEGNWFDATPLIEQLSIDDSEVSKWYTEACSWADKTMAYI